MSTLTELFFEDTEIIRFLTDAYLKDISTIDFINSFRNELSFTVRDIEVIKSTLKEYILTHKEELIEFGKRRLSRFEGNFKEMIDEPSGGRSTRFAWAVPTEVI